MTSRRSPAGAGPFALKRHIRNQGINAIMFARDTFETIAGDLTIIPIHHASFIMTFGIETIYFDPVGAAARYADFDPPTLIVLTHHHGDHLDLERLSALATPETDLVAPRIVHDTLPEPLRARTTLIANGETAAIHGIPFEAVPMYNTTPERTRYHIKGEGNGYVMTFGKTRVYLASDTEDTPEVRGQKDIDIAILPMNLPYTMTPDQVASALTEMKPKVAYPHHYEGTDPQALLEAMPEDSPTDVRLREWYPEA